MARSLLSHSQAFTPTDGPRESVRVLLKFGREVPQQWFSRGERNSRRDLPRLMHVAGEHLRRQQGQTKTLDFGLARVLPQGRPVGGMATAGPPRTLSPVQFQAMSYGARGSSCADDSPLLLNDTGSQEAVALAGGRRSRWASCKASGLVSWCAGRLVLPNLGGLFAGESQIAPHTGDEIPTRRGAEAPRRTRSDVTEVGGIAGTCISSINRAQLSIGARGKV